MTAWGTNTIGVNIFGHALGTLIDFAPSSSIDAGFHFGPSINGMVVRDLDIRVNSNVDKAIYIDATTGNSSANLFDNLRIRSSTGALASVGQKGIYVKTDGASNTTHNTTFRRIHLRFMDQAMETVVGNISNRNTSFIKLDDIFMWNCGNGIKEGDNCIEHQYSHIIFQDGATHVASYAISIGEFSHFNQINGVIADALDGSGTADPRRVAAVILNGGAYGNKVSLVMNTSGNAVLDFSGNMLNEIYDSEIFTGRPNEFKQIESRWNGFANVINNANATNGTNYLIDLTGIGNYANATQLKDANDGLGRAFVTTSVANEQSGFRTTSTIMQGKWLPKLSCRFKLSHTNNQRIWILFTSSSAAPPTNNTYTNDISVFGLAVNDVASNFQVIRNDATGAALYENMVKDDGVTIIPIETTRWNDGVHAHELVIMAERGGDWYIGLDRYKPLRFGTADTNVPALATDLGLTIVEETTGAATRTLQLFDVKLNSIK